MSKYFREDFGCYEELEETSPLRRYLLTWPKLAETICVNQTFITVTNARQKQFKGKKDLFWLMVSEASVHG
jgi:hypothetical protein